MPMICALCHIFRAANSHLTSAADRRALRALMVTMCGDEPLPINMPFAEVFFHDIGAGLSDKPRLKAFCRVAFSVLFKARAILAADFVLRARAFNLRICSAYHARLFARLLTIWRPRDQKGEFAPQRDLPGGSRPIRCRPDLSR